MAELPKNLVPDTRYIGDGVYVSFDGFQYKLESEQDGVEQIIFLPTEVLAALNRYVERKRIQIQNFQVDVENAEKDDAN